MDSFKRLPGRFEGFQRLLQRSLELPVGLRLLFQQLYSDCQTRYLVQKTGVFLLQQQNYFDVEGTVHGPQLCLRVLWDPRALILLGFQVLSSLFDVKVGLLLAGSAACEQIPVFLLELLVLVPLDGLHVFAAPAGRPVVRDFILSNVFMDVAVCILSYLFGLPKLVWLLSSRGRPVRALAS